MPLMKILIDANHRTAVLYLEQLLTAKTIFSFDHGYRKNGIMTVQDVLQG